MKHLYTNGTETYIAENEQGAMEAWEWNTGDVDMSGDWWMVPDDQAITVYFEDEIKPEYLPAGAAMREVWDDECLDHDCTCCITAKAGEWANCNWRDDFLCTTEW